MLNVGVSDETTLDCERFNVSMICLYREIVHDTLYIYYLQLYSLLHSLFSINR